MGQNHKRINCVPPLGLNCISQYHELVVSSLGDYSPSLALSEFWCGGFVTIEECWLMKPVLPGYSARNVIAVWALYLLSHLKKKKKKCSSKACCCIRLNFSVVSDLPIFLFSTFSCLEPYPKPFPRFCSFVCVYVCSVQCFTVNAGVFRTPGCSQHAALSTIWYLKTTLAPFRHTVTGCWCSHSGSYWEGRFGLQQVKQDNHIDCFVLVEQAILLFLWQDSRKSCLQLSC